MSKLNTLWQYQQADCELDKLESALKSTPSRAKLNKLHAYLSEQQAKVSSYQKQLEAQKAAAEKLAERIDAQKSKLALESSEFNTIQNDSEAKSEEATESRKSLELLLRSSKSARIEQESQLAALRRLADAYKQTMGQAAKAKKEFDALKAVCETEAAEAQPDIAKAKTTAQAIAGEVDPALLARYKVIKTRHLMPMAKIVSDMCGGCSMSLPTTVIKRVAAGTGIVECENCGRILFNH